MPAAARNTVHADKACVLSDKRMAFSCGSCEVCSLASTQGGYVQCARMFEYRCSSPHDLDPRTHLEREVISLRLHTFYDYTYTAQHAQ